MKKFIRVLMLVCLMAALFTVSAYAEEYYVESQEDFENALATALDGSTINLAGGEYKMVGSNRNISLNIVGAGQGITNIVLKSGDYNYDAYYGSLNFSNLDVTSGNSIYSGLAHLTSASYTNVTFHNQFFNYATSASFNGCTFEQSSSGSYNIWTYGGANMSFTNCTFNSAGKAMLIYNENHTGGTYNISSCTFNASSPVEGKAAIEIDSSLLKDGKHFTVNIDSSNTANGFGVGSVSGNSLYNLKKGDETTCTINYTQPPVNPNPNPNPGGNGGAAKPAASNPYSIPATADNSNMTLWSLLFVAFAAVAVITAKKRKA